MRELWVAITPSGKILEVKLSEIRQEMPMLMLPPCNSKDLPVWVPFVERKEYDKLKK